MSEREYYCPKCDDAYGPISEEMDICPTCKTTLITPVPEDFYARYPEAAYIRDLLKEDDQPSLNISSDALIQKVMQEVTEEYKRAASKFAPMHSAHEGWAVIKEEFDELWNAIMKNDAVNMHEEAVQVSAMGIRFLIDVVYANRKEVPAGV